MYAQLHLLLPSTDRVVGVEAIVVALVLGVASYRVRRQPELRLFVAGLWVASAAFFGLRALH